MPRLRLGIGAPPENEDIIDYVLDPFCVQDEVEELLERSGTALEVYFAAGIEVAMNDFNGS